MVIRAGNEDARFAYPHILCKRKILLIRPNPRSDLRKLVAERHTFLKRLAVFFRIYEKFTLADDALGTGKLMQKLVKVHNLLYRKRDSGLLPVAEGGIRNPYLVREMHWNRPVVERDLRHLVVIEHILEQVGFLHVLQCIVIIVFLQQVRPAVPVVLRRHSFLHSVCGHFR